MQMFIQIVTGATGLYSIICISQFSSAIYMCLLCVFQAVISLFSLSRFLADLMDGPELIRNVTLCGHLHHGKVRVRLMAASGPVSLFSCVILVRVLVWHLAKEDMCS